MKNKPVNTIETNGDVIRVNDRTSEIQLTLKDINGNDAKLTDTLDYFYLTNDNKHLYEVTDYSIENNIITFKMPPVPRGLFRIEIKDSNGVIYPSGDDVEITVKISLEEGINTAYLTYQDIVTNHVEKTALKYIDEHPEKFKGQDGKDGVDGKDGKDGKDGLNGRDGKDGQDGINGRDGVDGRDGKDGVDGLDGEKGEKGGFNGENIGVMNMIDLTKLNARGTTSTYDFDVDNGIINYNNVEWYLNQDVILNGVKHVFRVEDYLTNTNFNNGTLQIVINNLSGDLIKRVNVNKKETTVIDMTGYDRQTYDFQLRVTNNEIFRGFIEKPILVEGDYTVLWNMSEKDRIIYHNINAINNYSLATINNQEISGTISTPNKVTLSVPTGGSTQTVSNNNITLNSGIWLVTINTYMTPVNFNGYINIYLYLNESKILQSQIPSSQLKNRTLSHIFKVENIAQFSLRTAKQSIEGEVSFSGIDQNKISLTRLGGI